MLDLLKEIENTMCRRYMADAPIRVRISKLLDDLKPQEPYLAAVRVVRKQVESAKERSERTTK